MQPPRSDPTLVDWIEQSISFPNSMVDRITPATTDADRAWLVANYGLTDLWPVVTEPFRQWVVEDNFAGARPPLEELDVIVTADVEPYELMKLRLLNAGHSCLAYSGRTRRTRHRRRGDGRSEYLHRFVDGFLDHEAKPVVPPVAGIDLDAYTASLIERFSNPHIGDQIARLCLDGSAKFPKFLLPTVRTQLDAGGPVALERPRPRRMVRVSQRRHRRRSDDHACQRSAARRRDRARRVVRKPIPPRSSLGRRCSAPTCRAVASPMPSFGPSTCSAIAGDTIGDRDHTAGGCGRR